jgi:hypothetical protein
VREDYRNFDIDVLAALTVDLPRFIWRVMMRVDDVLQFDFLFDATGIAHHDLLVYAVSTQRKGGYALLFSLLAVVPWGSSSLPVQARAVLKRFQKPEI